MWITQLFSLGPKARPRNQQMHQTASEDEWHVQACRDTTSPDARERRAVEESVRLYAVRIKEQLDGRSIQDRAYTQGFNAPALPAPTVEKVCNSEY
jgi:hypothetical protein